MIRIRMPVGRLNHLTAASGADLVRAHRVPPDLRGDLLITEPVGRLIRRARPVKAGRPDPAAQRVSRIRVHPEHGSAVPADQHHDGARRFALHRGHVPRHHPGRKLDAARLVSPAQDRPVSARQDHRSRPHLAAPLRRRAHDPGDAGRSRGASHARDPGAAGAAARSRPAADARRNTGAARRASQPRERLVARYRPAAAGVAAEQIRRSRRCRIWSGRRATCWHASTRSGRSKGLARSTQRSSASS